MIGNLTGKIVIVTGAGQGIGKGIAKIFSAAGAKVVVATRTIKNGQQTVDTIKQNGGDALLIQTDVSDKNQIDRMIAKTIEHYGKIDIVIHNAGVFPMVSIENLTEQDLNSTLDVNLKAGFWIIKACLSEFRRRKVGRFIFTSSVTGPSVALPLTAHYAASKAGLNGLIKTAALELARENITVNGVEPGYILTQAMLKLVSKDDLSDMAEMIPNGQLGAPEDIANAMLFLASDEASYINGQTIVVDGGSTLPESPVVLQQFYQK